MKITPEVRKAAWEAHKHALAVQRYVSPAGRRHLAGLLNALDELKQSLEEKGNKIELTARPSA